MNQYAKYTGIAVLSSIVLFFLFSVPSAMISNPFFIRMTPPTMYEWFILTITAVLAGTYITLYYYKKESQSVKGTCAATGGSFLGFLTFGCAFCNKLLIFLLGISGIMTYFLPIQPYLGALGIVLLGVGIYTLVKKQ